MQGHLYRAALSWLLALAITGCASGDEGLAVEVSFEAGMPRSARDQAVRVEVYLVASCDALVEAAVFGTRPVEAIATASVIRDGRVGALGDGLAPGEYGLYAVAQDAECAVVAAGCDPVTIEQNGSGVLAVTVAAFPSEGCGSADLCNLDTGDCRTGAGGTGGEGGAGGVGGVVTSCTSQPEETLCTEGGTSGRCRSGACCTGCWDGSTCHSGDENVRCGAAGQPALPDLHVLDGHLQSREL